MKLRLLIVLALLATASLSAQVSYDSILRADRQPQNWLTYSGNYAGHRFSPLTQINRSNVKNLQLKWSYHPLYTKNSNNQNKMENTPLVVDGVMFTGTALETVALDAGTGRQFGVPIVRRLHRQPVFESEPCTSGECAAARQRSAHGGAYRGSRCNPHAVDGRHRDSDSCTGPRTYRRRSGGLSAS